MNYNSREIVLLYPVFPSQEITMDAIYCEFHEETNRMLRKLHKLL